MGVVACYEVQYRPWCNGCIGITGQTCACHALEVMGDRRQVLGGHVVFWYAPFCPVMDDGGLCGFGFFSGSVVGLAVGPQPSALGRVRVSSRWVCRAVSLGRDRGAAF